MNLQVTPKALDDLKDIREYISVSLRNPNAAERVIRKIIGAYTKLPDNPFIGARLRTDMDLSTPFRYLVSGNYLIFYTVIDNCVEIYRIIYGRRDYISILMDDEDIPEDGAGN